MLENARASRVAAARHGTTEFIFHAYAGGHYGHVMVLNRNDG